MDLSKAFECIPHDLLIAKLHEYGLDFDTVTFPHNFLNHRKQSVKIDNISSFFRTIEKESKSVVDWFRNNNMIANPDKNNYYE